MGGQEGQKVEKGKWQWYTGLVTTSLSYSCHVIFYHIPGMFLSYLKHNFIIILSRINNDDIIMTGLTCSQMKLNR